MTDLGGCHRGGQTSRARPNNRHTFCGIGFCHGQFGFITGAWVHKTRTDFSAECMIQARLVTCDAGRDGIALPRGRLGHEMGIGQKGACHADHIRASICQYLFGNFGCVDAV